MGAAMGERLKLITDASYDGVGTAAIAVAGSLGEHVEVVPARSNMHAEELALLAAMGLVYRHGCFHHRWMPAALFVIDCDVSGTDRVRRWLAAYRQWELDVSTRASTHAAHRLAYPALRRLTRPAA